MAPVNSVVNTESEKRMPGNVTGRAVTERVTGKRTVSRSASRTTFTQARRVILPWCAARYAPVVRTPGSQPPMRELRTWVAWSVVTRSVTTKSNHFAWLPAVGFHCGFQRFAVFSTGNPVRPRQNPRRARSAPALSVEFNSPCRSQHAGAGIYFDHTLTECETGVRRNPGRAGVRGLSHTGAVKQGGLAVSHPRQTPDEILDRLWTDRGATMRQRLAVCLVL